LINSIFFFGPSLIDYIVLAATKSATLGGWSWQRWCPKIHVAKVDIPSSTQLIIKSTDHRFSPCILVLHSQNSKITL